MELAWQTVVLLAVVALAFSGSDTPTWFRLVLIGGGVLLLKAILKPSDKPPGKYWNADNWNALVLLGLLYYMVYVVSSRPLFSAVITAAIVGTLALLRYIVVKWSEGPPLR